MKTVITLALKDLSLIRRDWLGLIFIVGLPISMGILMGFVSISFSSPGEQELPLAVVDEDSSDNSQLFLDLLSKDGNVKTELVEKKAALEDVRMGRRAAVLVIPPGFGENAGVLWSPTPATLELGVDPSRQAETGMLEGYIMKAMGEMTMNRFQDVDSMRPIIDQSLSDIENNEGMSTTQRLLLTTMMTTLDSFLNTLSDVQEASENEEGDSSAPTFQLANIVRIGLTTGEPMTPTNDQADEPSNNNDANDNSSETDKQGEDDSSTEVESLTDRIDSHWDISFPSAIVWGVLGCAAGFAISIVRERTRGTLTRLQVAPITRSQILMGKGLACFTAVIGVVFMMTTIGYFLGLRPDSLPKLAFSASCMAFCYVGIMMAMSVIAKTEEAVGGASWGINVFSAMFGGGMIPLAFMPSFMRPISHFSPVKWSVLSLEGAIWRGFTWIELLFPCAVLLGIGSVGLFIGCMILSRE